MGCCLSSVLPQVHQVQGDILRRKLQAKGSAEARGIDYDAYIKIKAAMAVRSLFAPAVYRFLLPPGKSFSDGENCTLLSFVRQSDCWRRAEPLDSPPADPEIT